MFMFCIVRLIINGELNEIVMENFGVDFNECVLYVCNVFPLMFKSKSEMNVPK